MNVGGKGKVKLSIDSTAYVIQDVCYALELKNPGGS